MSHADIPARHEQILYVSRIQASVRHRVDVDGLLDADGLEFLSREKCRVLRVRIMQVNRPGCRCGSVVIRHVTEYVVLAQHNVSQKTPRFPLACDVGHPGQSCRSELLFHR